MPLSSLGAGDPFQHGNGLRNKNFSKITFRALAIAALITALLAIVAYHFARRNQNRRPPNSSPISSLASTTQPNIRC